MAKQSNKRKCKCGAIITNPEHTLCSACWKEQHPSHSFLEKTKFHRERSATFLRTKPKGSTFSYPELGAYSTGYAKRAELDSAAYNYNQGNRCVKCGAGIPKSQIDKGHSLCYSCYKKVNGNK